MARLEYARDRSRSLPIDDLETPLTYTRAAHREIAGHLLSSHCWHCEAVAGRAFMRLPTSMFVRPSRFDFDDDARVEAVDLVEVRDDICEW